MTTKQDLKTRIKDAIEACASGPFAQNALDLLATLGYQGPRLSYFSEKSFAEFDAVFVQGNPRFNPKKAHAAQWASVDVLLQLTADQLAQQDNLFTSDKVDNSAYESYLFFAIELKPKGKGQAWTRTDLSQITREVNKLFLMPAMILFKHPGTTAAAGPGALSFAVIDRRLHKRESSKDVLEKITLIKDIRTTGTNRAHIEILFDLSMDELRRVHQFATFPALHAAWRKTLDTKELNKKFFRELSNWYFHTVAVAEFPSDSEPDRDKRNATHVIRLITRLMFVWFLREKELVPDALFDPKELAKILKPDTKEPSLYYKAILQNLFFATLNTEMGKREFRDKGTGWYVNDRTNSMAFRYAHFFNAPEHTLKSLFDPIPFLNGGLFECLDNPIIHDLKKDGTLLVDGFSEEKRNPLHLPDSLFFNPQGEEHDFSAVYGTARARKEKVRGLIDILSSYKFTITENTPIEEEVALDPELLGKVFENLLANFNPETKTTARKQTGSFYTPREIVNYMVDESLIAYLQGAVGADHDPPADAPRGGVPQRGGGTPQGDATANAVQPRLRHLLSYTEEPHQFTKAETETLIAAIDACKILDPACGSGAFPMGVLHKLVHVLHKLDPKNQKWKERQIEKAAGLDDPDIRERTIADIEDAFANNALDYGRKLYLIENCIHGVDIQPIAMQIAKLRFFISLIVDQRAQPYSPLSGVIASGAKQGAGGEGALHPNRGVRALPNLETKFVAANTLMKLEKEQDNLFTHPDIEQKKTELKRVRHAYFEARSPQRKAKCRTEDKRLREELAALLMQENELQPATAKMLAAWDPYDQNASAPFFDPEWMFGIKEGFDVVIGNPPYVRQESFKELKPNLKARYPETFTSTADLFTYFMQAGHELLAPRGVFCYIVSNKWMRAGYGAKLRAYLGKQQLLQLLDFGEQPVFEATAYTCVLLSQKAAPPKEHNVLTWAFTDLPLHDLPDFVATHAHHQLQSAFVAADYRIGSAAAEALMAKLKATGQPLGEYLKGGIYRGVLTGYNKAFVIDKATRDALIKADKQSKEVIKPFLVGKDVKRYGTPVPDKWLIFTRRGIKISDYPAIKKHLEKFREALEPKPKEHKGNWPGRKEGNYKWYEIQDSIDYYEQFEKPKIVTCSFAQQPTIMLEERGIYSNNKTTIFSSSERWLLSILNSTTTAYFIGQLSSLKRGGWFDYEPTYSSRIPIMVPSPKLQTHLERLVEQRMALPAGAEAEAIEQEIDQVVYGLYGLTKEEIGIVEGSRKKDKSPVTAEAPVEE